jgi:chemotaxis protein histidine kinase CheA
MGINLSEFQQVFFEEALELIGEIESTLLQFNVNEPQRNLIKQLFRAIHTINGNSATFGFNELRLFADSIQSLVSRVRDGEYVLTKEDVGFLIEANEFLRIMIKDLQSKQETDKEKLNLLYKKLEKIIKGTVEEKQEVSLHNGETNDEEVLDLGEQINCTNIKMYYDTFVKLIEQKPQTIAFKAGLIKRIDLSAVQLLASFIKTGKELGFQFKWISISPEAKEYINRLGFGQFLVGQ